MPSPPAALPRETAAAQNDQHVPNGLPQPCPPTFPLITLALPAVAENVHVFRAAAGLSLGPHGLEPMKDEVELVVSELAANAVAANAANVTAHIFSVCMAIGTASDGLLVEMHDNSPKPPQLKEFSLDNLAEGGQGLRIVDSLCNRWAYSKYPPLPGTRAGSGGYIKCVWGVLPFPKGPGA